jgi:hypothetical protein
MAHDLVELANDLIQIHALWLTGIATDKGEDLSGEPPSLADAPLSPFELLAASLVQRLAAKLFQASERDRQEVVELMGHPRSNGADYLDPFRLTFRKFW